MHRRLRILALSCLVCLTAHPHPGGLDANGGHTNRKTGEYHSHRVTPAPPTSPSETYWLNTATGVRHNSRCGYYSATSKGRFATASEGRACKNCGG